jgi:hypothetical protein
MNGVYAWMAGGIGITAAVAYGISQDVELAYRIHMGGFGWLVYIGVFVMAIFLGRRLQTMDRGIATASFFVFSGLMGVMLSRIPLMYSAVSIVGVFAATVGMFAAMALFGFVTKKDLSGMGQFLVMALFGAIIASVVNIFFLHNVGMSLVVSAIVAVAAAGLTAYDTQAIKQLYLMHGARGNLAILGALLLYINFINLFVSLLHLFGGSRD